MINFDSDSVTRTSTRVNKGVPPTRFRDESATTSASQPSPPHRPPGSATPTRPAGPAFSPPHPAQLFPHQPPPLPQGGANPLLVAMQHAGHQAAQLAGREAAWTAAQVPQPGPVHPGPGQDGGGGHGVREVAGVIDGEQVSVADMLDPVVPGPHPGPVLEDTEGWNLIDLWGVWDCMLCEFPTMQNIPRIYREVWASAMAKIMGAIQRADEGIELE